MKGRVYEIREVPRGPIIGWVESVRRRVWKVACDECGQALMDNTRAKVTFAYVGHWRSHWLARRGRP